MILQITPTKRQRKRMSSRIGRLSLKSFPPMIVLALGMGLGVLITQHFLPLDPPSGLPLLTPENQSLRVKACFTPESHCTPQIIESINAARTSLYVQAYSFTSAPIANALVLAKERGVDVRVILDKSQLTARGSPLPALLEAQIPLFIDQISGIAHNKVMIIDDALVLTGSFNFTNAADTRNAENILWLYDVEMARLYKTNWERREKHAKAYPEYHDSFQRVEHP